MSIIQDSDREMISKQLESLTNPVKIVNFSQTIECQFCKETSELIRELGQLSDNVESLVYDFVEDKDSVHKYNVEYIPATIIMGDEDHGIKFYGIPSGYEFATILETIKMVSSGDSGLSPATKNILGKLKEPLNLKVFVSPNSNICTNGSVSSAVSAALINSFFTCLRGISYPNDTVVEIKVPYDRITFTGLVTRDILGKVVKSRSSF